MTPLNVIWRRKRFETVFESFFMMRVLLGNLGRAVRVVPLGDDEPFPLMDNMLIVSHGTELQEYIEAVRAQGYRNIGLFHMADEHGTDDRSFYATADYVIRHYWVRDALEKPSGASLGVIWVPNGYRDEVGPTPRGMMLRMADRTVAAFFAGTIEERTLSEERREMLRTIETAKLPFTIVRTHGFGQELAPSTYAAYLGNARFALVPGGNSPETVRLYDALETGAIPIMLRSGYVDEPQALGSPPTILLDRWSDLPAACAPYADPTSPAVLERLQAKQDQIVGWWKQFVENQQSRVRALIDRSFVRASEQPRVT